jgi:hypothetical protein
MNSSFTIDGVKLYLELRMQNKVGMAITRAFLVLRVYIATNLYIRVENQCHSSSEAVSY